MLMHEVCLIEAIPLEMAKINFSQAVLSPDGGFQHVTDNSRMFLLPLSGKAKASERPSCQ